MSLESVGMDTSDSGMTPIVSGAIDTKGAYVELVASSGQDCEWLTLFVNGTAGKEGILLDIATGAAASEVDVISNISIWSNATLGLENFIIPITIASGTRISARCQGTTGTLTFNVGLILHDDDAFGTAASNITVGANTGTSQGTDIDPGGTANTKGAYTELVASSSADIDWMAIMIDPSDNNGQTTADFLFDIAIGAASSEVVVVANLHFASDSVEVDPSRAFVVKETIVSGSRISVRSQSSITDATDRVMAASIIGANMTAPAGGGGASGVRLGGTVG